MALNETDRKQYQQVNTFDDLIKLNTHFLNNPSTVTSPFTLKLEQETNPLVSQLTTINQLGLLTTSSSPYVPQLKRPYLIGVINSQQAEKLECVLNQLDGIIAYTLPCRIRADIDDEELLIPDYVDLPQFPVTFGDQGKEVKEYVTCFNWWTLLKPAMQPQVYTQLGKKLHNLYVIDTSKQGADVFLDKVIQALKQL